jgi:putative membrane protein
MPSAHAHFEPWSIPLLLTLALAGTAVVYCWRRRGLPTWRVAAFLTGVFAIWLAIASPLATLDHQLLTFHMVKHLLLMTVAAPFILLGLPKSRSLRWSGGSLILFWLVGAATVIGWHIPAAFQLAIKSNAWHNVENASFLLAGLLFWWPVVQSRPEGDQWSVPLYLLLATMPCDALSAFLVFCGRVVYPAYHSAPRHFHLSPLDDQEFAGALMWVAVTLIYLVPAVVITMRLLSPRVEHSQIQVSA